MNNEFVLLIHQCTGIDDELDTQIPYWFGVDDGFDLQTQPYLEL